ncbi:MAG: ASKHA domain-containing protein [Armatimonadota bacterium]
MSAISKILAPDITETHPVSFAPDGVTIQVAPGTTILQAARKAGVHIDAPCGEHGRCGKCRVRILDGHDGELHPEELLLLKPQEIDNGVRLSCLTQVFGPLSVEVPESSRNLAQRKATAELRRAITPAPFTRKVCVTVPASSLTGGDLRDDLDRLREALLLPVIADLGAARDLHPALVAGEQTVTAVLAGDHLIAVEAGDTRAAHYGLALDIGTTTLVGYLLDLRTGKEVAVSSQPNPQAGYGADVISRIQYVQGNPAHLETLRQSVTKAINAILTKVAADAGIDHTRIYEMVVVGNTCMSHLFLGIDPLPLGHAPYTPVITDAMIVRATDLGLHLHPCGCVRTLPNIAGFVGADTVGVLAASDLKQLRGLNVAVDIGTNAEVMAAMDGHIIACSTAAGPAFEGAKISHGMRAQPGAIDGVTIGQDLFVHTIGDKPAMGICGSGVIDAIGELRRVGMLESTGRLLDADEIPDVPPALRDRLIEDGIVMVRASESGTGHDIVLTRKDIREVQLVKAAIFAGTMTLLDKIGHRPDELDSLIIAGAFGTYITKEHALAIGLIPNIALDKLVFLGNGAGAGAKIALISHEEYTEICANAHGVDYIELAGDPVFADNFMLAMTLAPGCED